MSFGDNEHQPALEAMLICITALFPGRFPVVEKKIGSANQKINTRSVASIFALLRRAGGFYAYHEKARLLPAPFGTYLPDRWVFTAPYVRFIHNGPQRTSAGTEIETRLIFEFYDRTDYREAEESIVFSFSYYGRTGFYKKPKIQTSHAFQALESSDIEDYKPLQNFLNALVQNPHMTEVISELLDEVDICYAENDERSRGFKYVRTLLKNPAPAFVLP